MSHIATLALVAILALGGCAVTSTERIGADGSKTTTRSVEWVPGPSYYVSPPIYGAYGYGRSYGSLEPIPHVVYGGMVRENVRFVLVNGVGRLCDIRYGQPHFCGDVWEATRWSRGSPPGR